MGIFQYVFGLFCMLKVIPWNRVAARTRIFFFPCFPCVSGYSVSNFILVWLFMSSYKCLNICLYIISAGKFRKCSIHHVWNWTIEQFPRSLQCLGQIKDRKKKRGEEEGGLFPICVCVVFGWARCFPPEGSGLDSRSEQLWTQSWAVSTHTLLLLSPRHYHSPPHPGRL